jgi:PAS domain S-box-containing protein
MAKETRQLADGSPDRAPGDYAAADLLPAILSSVGQPVWVVNERGEIAYANPAALEALGYAELSDLLGRPSHETIHHHRPDGSVYPVSECPMLLPRQTGETISVEEDWFFRQDGSMFPVAYKSAPIELPSGRGAVVAFTDIEERLRVEQVLRERDTILETLNQPVFVADEGGIVRYVNPSAVRVLGFDNPSEIVGQNGHWLVHYKRPDGSPYPIEECELTRARENGDPAQRGEDWFVRKDGSMVRLTYTVAPIAMRSGLGSVIAFNDVEERRRAEEAARQRDIAEARADALEASEKRIRWTLAS